MNLLQLFSVRTLITNLMKVDFENLKYRREDLTFKRSMLLSLGISSEEPIREMKIRLKNLNERLFEIELEMKQKRDELTKSLKQEVHALNGWSDDFELEARIDYSIHEEDPIFSLEDDNIIYRHTIDYSEFSQIGDTKDHNDDCSTPSHFKQCFLLHHLLEYTELSLASILRIGECWVDFIARHQRVATPFLSDKPTCLLNQDLKHEHINAKKDFFPCAVIGIGALGESLSRSRVLHQFGLTITTLFDFKPEKIDDFKLREITFSMSDLEKTLLTKKVRVVILTVEDSKAQEVTDRLSKLKIDVIWNFTAVSLKVPKRIFVKNEHLLDGFYEISKHLKIKS